MLLGSGGDDESRLKCHRQCESAPDDCRSNLEHEAILTQKSCGPAFRLSYEKDCAVLERFVAPVGRNATIR
jgi:hypothetical protein